jgi:hypothetical protein
LRNWVRFGAILRDWFAAQPTNKNHPTPCRATSYADLSQNSNLASFGKNAPARSISGPNCHTYNIAQKSDLIR